MARQRRILSNSNYYHILIRGNNKNYIFEKNKAKKIFWDKLCVLEFEKDLELAAWCIMNNHVHLVAKVEPEKLSKAMKRLNTSFAMYWHRTNHSVGHVFQDRFKSIPIESDVSLLNVIRYVHNNPVKAKLVKHIGEYNWSSYQNYLLEPKNDVMEFVWKLFNSNEKRYIDFHQEEDDREYLEIKEDQYQIRQEYANKIINKVCDKYKLNDRVEISRNPLILREIVKQINDRSNISLREFAKLIGVNESKIKKIKKSL